ncbi:hypothetical protein BaRGS_00007605 [Batillaria attramentaria]|uniref:Uncharacterized protein n=1 Tax=Batillaria attramentaria TaxID=370345 RepID=A0ABD0LPI0_9CAEN
MQAMQGQRPEDTHNNGDGCCSLAAEVLDKRQTSQSKLDFNFADSGNSFLVEVMINLLGICLVTITCCGKHVQWVGKRNYEHDVEHISSDLCVFSINTVMQLHSLEITNCIGMQDAVLFLLP